MHSFQVLQLVHPRRLKRDTAKYFRLRMMANTDVTPSLKLLAKNVLGIDIQNGEHDSASYFFNAFHNIRSPAHSILFVFRVTAVSQCTPLSPRVYVYV